MKIKMFRLIIAIILLFTINHVLAQTFNNYKHRIKSTFKQYKIKEVDNFNEYRNSINAEFAEYMRKKWPSYKIKQAIPIPSSPEPPTPVTKEIDNTSSNDHIPYNEICSAPKEVEQPQPAIPLPKPAPSIVPTFTFSFYGMTCEIPIENKHSFTLSDINENCVADGWKILSSESYLPIISKCLEYRDNLNLCDWGFFRFVEQMTISFFSSSQLNEACLMQMYILTQSGYKVRIGRTENKLVLLLASKDIIYQHPYLYYGGYNYYLVDSSLSLSSINIFNHEFPKEQQFSLNSTDLPLLPITPSSNRKLQSRHNKEILINFSSNKNLIDYYNDYPRSSHFGIYSKVSISEHAKQQLYPILKRNIENKNEHIAANILLHFVQTAFDYATDDKQFGKERPLFSDETLFYPYSDCEDRAILFSVLIHDLLGLDVVFLLYPGHLATAVCFNEEVQGDHLYIEGKRYIVCDPTYINSNIGQAMPQFKKTSAEIIKTR